MSAYFVDGLSKKALHFLDTAKEEREMKSAAAASLLIYVFFAAIPGAALEQKPPLVVNFIVDPKMRERVVYGEDLERVAKDITQRASMIFNAEIGRPLAVGTVEIGTPAKNYDDVVRPEELFTWLKKKDNGNGQFVVFLFGGAFFDPKHDRILGSDSSDGRLIILEGYVFERQRVAFALLHQIGHLCGAEHTKDPTSIMSFKDNKGISYGEAIPVIHKKCG